MTINGSLGSNDYSAINTMDNNIAICGLFTDSNSIVKFSENGNIIWSKPVGYFTRSLVQNKNGNFFLCGYYDTRPDEPIFISNTVLIKTNSNGDTLWTKKFDHDRDNSGANILETNDENILVAGFSDKYKNGRGIGILLSKFDYNGNLIWRKLYDEHTMISMNHILETTNGDLFITANSPESDLGITLVKLNSNGEKVWGKSIKSDTFKTGYCALELSDNQLLVCGDESTNDSTRKVLILKLDKDGNILLEKKYGEEGYSSSAVSMKRNKDGTVVITGNYHGENTGILFMKIDEYGNQIITNKYQSQYYDQTSNIINQLEYGYLITGLRIYGEMEGRKSFITKVFEENNE